MLGEGVINDAVSIIVYQTILQMKDANGEINLSLPTIATSIGMFCYLIIASVGIGIVFALSISFFTKKITTLKENPVFEISLMFLFGYLSFVVA